MNLRMQNKNKIYYVNKDTLIKKTYGLIILNFFCSVQTIYIFN